MATQTLDPVQVAFMNETVRPALEALVKFKFRADAFVLDYDSTGAQTINGSASTVNINTERTNSDSSMFSLASDVLTVSLIGGGTIDLSYLSTIGNTGSDDFCFDVFVEQAPASTGTFAEVTGARLKAGQGT